MKLHQVDSNSHLDLIATLLSWRPGRIPTVFLYQSRSLIPALEHLQQQAVHFLHRRNVSHAFEKCSKRFGVLHRLACSLALSRKHGVGRIANQDDSAFRPGPERWEISQLPETEILRQSEGLFDPVWEVFERLMRESAHLQTVMG